VSNMPFNAMVQPRLPQLTQPIVFGPFHFDFVIHDLRNANALTYR
jgi:hypothetical protein